MKMHIGVDSKTTLAPRVALTTASVHGSELLLNPLPLDETRVRFDSVYAGQQRSMKDAASNALDFKQKKAARNRPLNVVALSRCRVV